MVEDLNITMNVELRKYGCAVEHVLILVNIETNAQELLGNRS